MASVRPKPVVPAHLVVLAMAFCGVLLLSACANGEELLSDEQASEPVGTPEPPGAAPAPEGIDGVVALDDLSTTHTRDPVEYDHRSPMGGPHHPAWLNCGFYTDVVPDEHVVHSLEHGAVWITYPSEGDLDPDDRATLEALADADGHVLVSPYPDLRAPFVLTAWGRQLELDSLDDVRFGEFLDAYLRAGAAPEPGAPCTGGVSP